MIIPLKNEQSCHSCYADEFGKYLQMRSIELAESTFAGEKRFILAFDRYVSAKTDSRIPLTNRFLDEWLSRRPGEKTNTQNKRLNATKRLFRFLQKCGICVEEIRLELQHTQSDYIPYIFSAEEIRSIFYAADSYRSTGMSPFLHLTVPISFRLLYGCGLRSSELVQLRNGDVNIDAGVLHIRNAKFNKTRYVPFTSSLAGYIRNYMLERHPGNNQEHYFIAKRENRPYSTNEVHYWFRKVLYHAGIPHNGKGYGPRVHDLRHTFAVHSLQKSITEGRETASMLPVLSAYLGHKDIRGTQTYLRLTSEFYPHITSVLERRYGSITEGGDDSEK